MLKLCACAAAKEAAKATHEIVTALPIRRNTLTQFDISPPREPNRRRPTASVKLWTGSQDHTRNSIRRGIRATPEKPDVFLGIEFREFPLERRKTFPVVLERTN